ncbi:MAG: phage holin [Acutalibacteraceae bacterium]|nr:phage holin [Acutalibacteraceae bacterium]
MSNKVYDVLKWIAQILLPAFGTLYFALAGIWGFPYGEEIVGTITAVDTFLGVCLGISSANYYAQVDAEECEDEGDDEYGL